MSDAAIVTETVDVPSNLATVQGHIADACRAANRPPRDVTLVAISKVHGPERIRPAILAGHRTFGENRVQEAEGKWPALRDEFADLTLHLVGPLQSNKVHRAVELFDVIETIDRQRIADRIAREIKAQGKAMQCFVQVNTGEEAQKAGIPPAETETFVHYCRDELALPVVGLMCIPPVDDEPSLHFSLLRELGSSTGLAKLSMGMSADYEIAVACGATHVRVGTAIFGDRPSYAGPTD
ncbi:MAG: YggS family pyridoxal phosphate-dependent enzyme [Alphaproteobacteria bacterium]